MKIVLKQGEAKTTTLTVTDENRASVDLSGAALTLGVKKDKSDSAYALIKADAAFDKSQAEAGIVTVDLAEDDTDLSVGTYIGELKCSWMGNTVIEKSADFYIQIKRAVTA